MNAIETKHLASAFGCLVAVDDLTLVIPEGTVFEFLGPNGAGKFRIRHWCRQGPRYARWNQSPIHLRRCIWNWWRMNARLRLSAIKP